MYELHLSEEIMKAEMMKFVLNEVCIGEVSMTVKY